MIKMILRSRNSSKTGDKKAFGNMTGMFESLAKSKKAVVLATIVATTSCGSFDRSALDKPIDVQTSEDASAEISTEDRPVMIVDSGITVRPTDATVLDVRQMQDIPTTVDVPVVVDVARPIDSGLDARADVSVSGCSRCVNGTITYSFGYPIGNSIDQNGYTFVRPLPEARLRVNCAISGNLVCEQSFSVVGERQTCIDGPNSITMVYNSTGSGQQRYVITVACH